MTTQYRCQNDNRRRAVGASTSTINGIDYLEVSGDQRTLRVHFLHTLPGQPGGVPSAPALTRDNVVVEGGVRIKNVHVDSVAAAGDVLTVGVRAAGDFSTYTLRIITSSTNPAPPDGFDRQLSEVAFSFKLDCPSDFDCDPERDCPEPVLPTVPIDYLAKDYASFRRLILDRLAIIMPGWQERSPADLGIALVEVLAYAGDQLSYFQDAAATEAYLGTARRRVSVRRHARLVDYFMHDGGNARVWVALEVTSQANGAVLQGPSPTGPGTQLLTRVEGLPRIVAAAAVPAAVSAGAEVFETMHDLELRAAHNEIAFYTWGDTDCCLPRGATRATLRRQNDGGTVQLAPGKVLILEEVRGPASGIPADADPSHRHAVRLTGVTPTTDPLFPDGDALVEIEWAPQDALPFPLCLSTDTVAVVSVARGNVVLADHGRTVSEPLPDVSSAQPYRPVLRHGPLTQQGRVRDRRNRLLPLDPDAPASAVFAGEMRNVQPAITLRDTADGLTFRPQRDLLNSDRFAAEFVVEVERDGAAHLRFGDGVLGREPVGPLFATYRVGNGRAGNVGARALFHVVAPPAGITAVDNPLAAQGGVDQEASEQVRLYAPQAFRTQERAVTEADYAAAAERHPEVQKAAATRRWTGSWYTMFVTVDRRRGQTVDAGFKSDLHAFLDRFRLAGYDLEVEAPLFVPLDIAFTVCVEPGYFRANVKEALLETFSNVDLPDGRRGFFHPDNFTFGQPVYLSQVVAAGMQVPGVDWIDTDDTPPKPNRFRRWGKTSRGELAAGRIALDRLEIAQLDNDPNRPENGRIDFLMQGGL